MTMSEQPSGAAPESVQHAAATRDHVRRLRELRRRAIQGDELATERQHAKGKLTARQQLEHLLDSGSFTELDLFRRQATGPRPAVPCTDGVVTSAGTVHGRRVFAYAQDFRILGGSLGAVHAAKIHKVMDLALATGAPLVALIDSGGARIQEGVTALAGYGGIFSRNVRASGVIPQISVVLGPCAGGAAYSPALTDFTFMVRNTSHMFVTGPDVIKAVTGESVTHEELGSARVHAATSGAATFVADDEADCLDDVRYLISLLPSNSHDLPPFRETGDPPDRRCPRLADIVPANPKIPYDIREVVAEIADHGEFMEVHEHWARNIVPQPLGSAAAVARAAARSQSLVLSLLTTSVGVRKVASRLDGTL
jgi:acetyl-CoA carboxylase carboxyltransferase component